MAACKWVKESNRTSGSYIIQACISCRCRSRTSTEWYACKDLLGRWSRRIISACICIRKSKRRRPYVFFRRFYFSVWCMWRGYCQTDQTWSIRWCDRSWIWTGSAGNLKSKEKRKLQCTGSDRTQAGIRCYIWAGKKWIKDWRWFLLKYRDREQKTDRAGENWSGNLYDYIKIYTVQLCMFRKRRTGNRYRCRTAVQNPLYTSCRRQSR